MYEYISEGMLSRDSCLTFFSLGMCTQGVRYALCRNESSPLTGAVPCAPLRSPDPGTSWQTPGRTCPREQLITSCENQDSVVKGTGRQLGCAVLCPVAPPCPTLRDPWTLACQAWDKSVGLLRQEYWSGLPFPSPGDLSHPGMEPASLMFPAFAGEFFTTSRIVDVQILALTFR